MMRRSQGVGKSKRGKFSVLFGYLVNNPSDVTGLKWGTEEPKNMSKDEVQFLIRALSPIKSAAWMGQVENLRRGTYVSFALRTTEENGDILTKMLKIERT